MNINTMNNASIIKALSARIKAKGCKYGSLAEAAWWIQGLENPVKELTAALSDYYSSLTLKQKIVFTALTAGEISITYEGEDYAHPQIIRAKTK